MADIYKGELQDNLGNTVYPHTESDVVFCADGKTVQEKLAGYENALGSVTGTTNSLEVSDPNILLTSEAGKKLSDDLGGVKLGIDGEGNRGYFGADGSLIPFSPKSFIYKIYSGTGSATYVAKVKCNFWLNMTYGSKYGYYIYLQKNDTYLIYESGENRDGSHNVSGELLPGDTLTFSFRPGDVSTQTISGFLSVGSQLVTL